MKVSQAGDSGGVKQALWLWAVFLALAVLTNGTIPFMLGADLHAWAFSRESFFVTSLIYAGIFWVAVLVLVKGLETVRRSDFLIPMLLACGGFVLWPFFPFAAAIFWPVLPYLHRRYDLTELGLRSRGWRGDVIAVVLLSLVLLVFSVLRGGLSSFDVAGAAAAVVYRTLGNPAFTAENLFYFGFLTDRVSKKTGKWLTPILVGGMYTLHEMTNPQYWYTGMYFPATFIAVTLVAAAYVRRRSMAVVWGADALSRFITYL